MNKIFNIALLQLNPPANQEESIARGLVACEKSRELGADLALFPELWSVGYKQKLFTLNNAINLQSIFIRQFCAKAKELEMAIAITYLGVCEGQPTNNVALIDRTGTILFEYAKVYTCNFKGGAECGLRAGTEFYVMPLPYADGTVRVGAMICFDREFPESARELTKKGADIIIVPNACNLVNDAEVGDVRLQQIRARAFENMVIIAVANYPAPSYDGNSCVCAANGTITAQAGMQEKILLVPIDLAAQQAWRARNGDVWGLQQ